MTEKVHIPFPEIGQYRNAVKLVRERAEHLGVSPTYDFFYWVGETARD